MQAIIINILSSSIISRDYIPTLRVNSGQSVLHRYVPLPIVLGSGAVFDIIAHLWVFADGVEPIPLVENVAVGCYHGQVEVQYFGFGKLGFQGLEVVHLECVEYCQIGSVVVVGTSPLQR